ncbi:MAG: FkbM family methyltransferase [Alphaproteobacteria bacterium]|nr:FkbM family methyltransferase [Alphaproteobacteria bacterium]
MLARSWGLFRSLLIYHAIPFRQRRLRRLLAPLVPPGSLAFDIGAHVGNRVRALRALGVRVITVEPQPVYAGLLRRFFAHDREVTVIEAAVGEQPGETRLFVSDRHPTVSTVSPTWRDRMGRHRSFRNVAWNREIAVRVETLDTLIERFGQPGFVKLDIEGAEAAALRGLSSPVAVLSFEVVPGAEDEAVSCIDRLELLAAYRYNWSPGESMRLALPEWLDAAAMREFITTHGRQGDIYCRLTTAPADPGARR